MLMGGYLWTGACGAVSVGGCGWASTCRQMYVGCWEELGKDRMGYPISERIFAGFSVFKFTGSTGSYSRGRSEGDMLIKNKTLAVCGRMVGVAYSVCGVFMHDARLERTALTPCSGGGQILVGIRLVLTCSPHSDPAYPSP